MYCFFATVTGHLPHLVVSQCVTYYMLLCYLLCSNNNLSLEQTTHPGSEPATKCSSSGDSSLAKTAGKCPQGRKHIRGGGKNQKQAAIDGGNECKTNTTSCESFRAGQTLKITLKKVKAADNNVGDCTGATDGVYEWHHATRGSQRTFNTSGKSANVSGKSQRIQSRTGCLATSQDASTAAPTDSAKVIGERLQFSADYLING